MDREGFYKRILTRFDAGCLNLDKKVTAVHTLELILQADVQKLQAERAEIAAALEGCRRWTMDQENETRKACQAEF